ncbi:MAG TPA: DarT ssDNA thymidine ADP-ribosyltransferase family protein [Cellvibrio sp.]|nr:DarT ssDNA thymidine ADP-ribosyltransferase family protein [Cellvibrio sp.]
MIEEAIRMREIEEIVHFTTLNGLIGILDSRFLRSRQRIADDFRLEFVLKLNSPIRRDPEWLDYVNLSITNINTEFFEISSQKWHQDVGWIIMSFDPEVLTHDGVTFTSTNNVYHKSVLRGVGVAGLNMMFLPEVEWGYYGAKKRRTKNHRPQDTTDIQAEVLYPAEVSIEHLRKVYVSCNDDQDNVCSIATALGVMTFDVVVEPEKFEVMRK